MLESPPPTVNDNWDIITIQPDPLLPDDGFYDALALVANSSLADLFVVDFVFLGLGEPGPQPFTINDPFFQVIESGTTVPIPEPGTWGLTMIGLFLLSSLRRRK